MNRIAASSALYLFCVLAVQADDDAEFAKIGDRVGAAVNDGVAVTDGVIRVRRRHENDMDFSKYNPFYWEGRATRFRIEDHTPGGEQRIKFTLFAEWPQDSTKYRGVDFSAIYIGEPLAHETLRSKFAINARMKHVADFRQFEHVLDEPAFRAFEDQLEPGKLVTIEFRFFNDESHGPWKTQQDRNHHNLSAYYSEFFRFRVGQPGIYIDNFQQPNALPSPRRYAGGWTTIPTVRVEPWRALQQQAFNLTQENASKFLRGRTWFHTDLQTGNHISDRSDDKPSIFFAEMEAQRRGYSGGLYNVTSCNACHQQNGSALLPNEPGRSIHTTIVKTMDAQSGAAHVQFGAQLQTAGPDAEGSLQIARYEKRDVKLGDGTIITLSQPVFAIKSDASKTQPALSPRRPPAVIGMGLLDAVPEKAIREAAASSNGIVSRVGERVGRFGWKASQPTLVDQIQDALLNDMGVLSNGKSNLDAPQGATMGKGRLPDEALDELVAYVALLGVPPRDNPTDKTILAGERAFHQLKCHSCHRPSWRTGQSQHAELKNQTIYPYTDLLLHDMGEALADDGPGEAARRWRTAPLWGLKNTRDANDDFQDTFRAGDTNITYEQTHAAARKNAVQLLHDGRARSLAEAILWHGGEAVDSVKAYKALSQQQRDQLDAFLWDL